MIIGFRGTFSYVFLILILQTNIPDLHILF